MADGGLVRATRRVHYAWVVLGTVTLMMLAASGVRASFGVFIEPVEAEFGWGRTSMSAVASLSLLLYGAIGPVVGRLADRWGPRRPPRGRLLRPAAARRGAGSMRGGGSR